MVDRLVIDASAGVAVIRGESDAETIRMRMASTIDAELLAPALFWIEVANVLIRRHGMTAADVVAGFATIDRYGIRTVEADRAALLSATDIAEQHRLTVYDATYLALAERFDAMLLTLDARLAGAAGARAIGFDGEVRETQAPYVLEPWIRWSELDAYLDAVREATIASGR
jgi:predicted nucleic acid-binding protein